MNYPAASYGVSNASIRNKPFAASCGELTRMRLKVKRGNVWENCVGKLLTFLYEFDRKITSVLMN